MEPPEAAAHTHVVPRPGESAPFHFTTHWQFSQTSDQVWAVFQNIGHWDDWWPGVRESTALNEAAGADAGRVAEAGAEAGGPTEGMIGRTAEGLREKSSPGAPDELRRGEGALATLIVHRPLVRDLHLALTVSRTVPPLSAHVVVAGDLRGHGHWRAADAGSGCRVEIVWCVVTRSRLAKVTRGASAWAHRRVMNGGLRGLRERLAASASREE